MVRGVTPFLRHALLCSHVQHDREGRVYSLIEPLHTITLAPDSAFPITVPEVFLYVQLEDAVGTYRLSVEARNEDGFVTHTTPPVEMAFDGTTHRIVPFEPALRIVGLAFPKPGRYDFIVKCNHASLHDREDAARVPFLRVLPS